MVHEFEGTKTDLSVFMTQVLELLHNLIEKVDNASTRLIFLEKKVRELQKDVKSLRMEKGEMEEEDEDEGEEEKGDKEVDIGNF